MLVVEGWAVIRRGGGGVRGVGELLVQLEGFCHGGSGGKVGGSIVHSHGDEGRLGCVGGEKGGGCGCLGHGFGRGSAGGC